MQYSVDIIIPAPRKKVIDLFDSSDNLKKWQPGLQSFTHLEGEPGKKGAKSKLLYLDRGKDVEIIPNPTCMILEMFETDWVTLIIDWKIR